MSKTVYLKIRQLTKTDKQDVYLSDVAEVYAEKKLLPKIKSIKLATFYRTKKDRICAASAISPWTLSSLMIHLTLII